MYIAIEKAVSATFTQRDNKQLPRTRKELLYKNTFDTLTVTPPELYKWVGGHNVCDVSSAPMHSW